MRDVPTQTMSYGALFNMLQGSIRAKIMMAGIDLKIFNELSDFRSAEDVARNIGTHPQNTRFFLDALATIDLVEKRNGLYRNLPPVQTFLADDSPSCLGPLFQLIQQMSVDSLDGLTELVKIGPPPVEQEEDEDSEALWAGYTKASAGWAIGEVGQMVARIISELPGFQTFDRMLDLGGGHGIFTLYIVSAHPHMEGVVFDRSAVVEVAKDFIEAYEMTDRVNVAAGDYILDDIGQGYDLIWASTTLSFAKHNIDPLFDKIFAALKPGGYFVSFQDGMIHEKTKPDTMLGRLAVTMMKGNDTSFDQGFLAEAMLRCGFRSVRSKTLHTPMGALDMDIACK